MVFNRSFFHFLEATFCPLWYFYIFAAHPHVFFRALLDGFQLYNLQSAFFQYGKQGDVEAKTKPFFKNKKNIPSAGTPGSINKLITKLLFPFAFPV